MLEFIPKLEKSNGSIINEQTTILREVKTFHENLYSSKDVELTDVDLKHVLSNADIKKLSQDESSLLEGTLTYQEVTKALKAMANNRSPSSDGFTAEF